MGHRPECWAPTSRDTARPFVQDLFSLTGETSQLAVRDGNMALYIDRVYGSKRVPRASRVGGRLPLHATAVGKVILAYSEGWVTDAYLGHPLATVTGHTHVNPTRLRAELARVREQGYATTQEEVILGSCSIAVPVFHTGHLGCSIALVVSSANAGTMTRHLPVLKGISQRIEAATAHIPLETLLGGHRRRPAASHRPHALEPLSTEWEISPPPFACVVG